MFSYPSPDFSSACLLHVMSIPSAARLFWYPFPSVESRLLFSMTNMKTGKASRLQMNLSMISISYVIRSQRSHSTDLIFRRATFILMITTTTTTTWSIVSRKLPLLLLWPITSQVLKNSRSEAMSKKLMSR